jgi:hypothetical protein
MALKTATEDLLDSIFSSFASGNNFSILKIEEQSP